MTTSREYRIHKRRLRFAFHAAVLLIILGLGNIIMGSTRAEVYTDLYRQLEATSKPDPKKVDEFGDLDSSETEFQPTLDKTIQAIEAEKLQMRLNRIRARLDFYKVVKMGGKCLLVGAALLLLYCLYASKEMKLKGSNPAD